MILKHLHNFILHRGLVACMQQNHKLFHSPKYKHFLQNSNCRLKATNQPLNFYTIVLATSDTRNIFFDTTAIPNPCSIKANLPSAHLHRSFISCNLLSHLDLFDSGKSLIRVKIAPASMTFDCP